MPIELDINQPSYDARIRVVGVGGGGGNAVRTMISRGLEGVEFIAANTDHQALMNNPAGVKIQLGKSQTRGLGAGANPEVGRRAIEESIDDMRDALAGSDMIFVTAGMGGGTGTGAAPVIARLGRELGALVVAIVTKPFDYESKHRMRIAESGVRELRDEVDALIVIPNQRILSVVDKNVPFVEALGRVDAVLYNATKGIADIISGVGYVNVDFADVRAVMSSMGDALMGIGTARGEHRAVEAATNALNSPILEGMSIFGAQGLLVNVTGGNTMSMHEVSEAVTAIEKAAGGEVNLIHGVVIDDTMDDEMSITVVATGFRHASDSAPRNVNAPVVTILPSVVESTPSKAPAKPTAGEAEAPQERSAPVPSALPRPTIVPHVTPVQPRETPRGEADLADYETPAALRRNPTHKTPATPAPPPAPIATDASKPKMASGYSSSSGSGTPAFLKKIMD
jgi:cell division protein FtsZ